MFISYSISIHVHVDETSVMESVLILNMLLQYVMKLYVAAMWEICSRVLRNIQAGHRRGEPLLSLTVNNVIRLNIVIKALCNVHAIFL